MANSNNVLEDIIEFSKTPEKFVLDWETKFNNKIQKIADHVAETGITEIIMIAGPSSAGKTTTATKIKSKLLDLGVKTHTVSLDDFYLDNKDAPRFPDGSPDFETVEALDIKCFQEKMRELIETEKTDLPQFDFKRGCRMEEYKHIEISPTDVIIVEGLHALNPVITDVLPQERLLKIYINVSSRIYDRRNNIILNKRNMRFIRRVVRDFNFRGNSVEETYRMWIKVRYGEDTYLFPYKDNADIKINTLHLYETCVLRDKAIKLLYTINKESDYYKESQRLIRNLQKFPQIDPNIVPEDSLLREFLGKKESN